MATPTPSMLTKITSGSLLTALILSSMWIASLASDVEKLTESEQKRNQDHDTLIEMKVTQKTIVADVSEIKQDVKDLDDKLDEILTEVRKQ